MIDALNAVLTDKADGYVDLNYVVQYYINKNFLLGLRAVGAVDVESTQLHMGIQKELKPLAKIINKVFSSISEKEKISIYRQWSFDAQKQQANNLNLTNKEKKWIQNNPNVSFTADPNWLPFEAFNESGKYIGIAADHLNVIEESTSLYFNKIVSKNWADAVDMATNSEVDVISGVIGEKFSNNYNAIPYLDNNIVVVMDKDSGVIDNPNEELSGKKIAIIKDYGYVGEVFEKYPNLNFTEVENVQEGLNGVATGEFDAMFGSVALLSYSMETMGFYQLKIVGETNIVMKLALFVKKDKPELFSVVSKALKNITTQNQNKILSRWFREVEGNKKVLLTQEEKEWLRNHPTIKIASEVDYAPFDFQIDGKPVGYSIDVIEMIAKRIGFKIEFVTETWDKLHEKAKNKEIDLIHTMKQTPERQKYLTMTKPYVTTYDAIFTNVDTQDISSFKDFKGKRIGVGKGENSAQVFEKIKDRDFELVLFSSYTEQLKALSFGKIDALVLDRSVGLYTAKENGIYNLKVVGSLEGVEGLMDQSLFRMGVRDDYPILRDIIQKGLDSIDEKTKQELTSKWLGTTIEKKVGDQKSQDIKLTDILPLKELAITFFIVILLLAAVIIYYKKTKQEDISIKGPIGVFVTLFLILISLSTLVSLHNMKNKYLEEIESSLNLVLNATYNTLSIWVNTNKNILSYIANDSVFTSEVESFMRGKSDMKESLENYMIRNKDLINDEEYYLISADYKIVMSNRENIIPKRVIKQYYKPYLDEAWKSGSSFVPPFKNQDITSEKIYLLNRVLSNNKTVAILAIAIDPLEEFSEITHQGRIGSSGETYVINKDAAMITMSRFNSELKEKGILKKNENSFLNLEIKTPDNVLTDASKNVLNKTRGTNVKGYLDYRGEKVLGAWRWIDEFNIGFISEIDEKEAIGQFDVMEKIITIIIFTIVLFAIILTFLLIWISAKSKKALENKNAELHIILESFDANVIASRTNLTGVITYASKAFCKISGYQHNEVIGKPHNIVRHPDMPSEAFEDMWKTLKSGNIWHGEVKNLKKDGGFYWTSVVAQPVYDSDGIHTGYSAIRQDTTAQKEVEELSRNLEEKVQERTKDLQESQERFQALFDSAPDGMNILKDGVYIDCNKASLKIYGVATKEEFINTAPSKYSPEYQDNGIKSGLVAKEKIQEAIEKGTSTFEWKYARLDTKEERYAEVILSPIYLDKKLHVYSVVRDITERKELENQVLQNQEQMTFVSNYANLGFWTFNPQIGDLFVNDIFVNMLGYDSHEVLKSGYEDKMFKPFKDGLAFWEQLLHPDDVERTNKIITAHINGETDLYKVDYRMRRADGTWMWSTAIGRIAEYDEDGNPIVFNGVNIDISEAKDLQEQLNFASSKANIAFTDLNPQTGKAYTSDIFAIMNHYNTSDLFKEGDKFFKEYKNGLEGFLELIHPNDLQLALSAHDDYVTGKTKSYRAEYRVIGGDGKWRWMLDTAEITERDIDKNPMRMLGVIVEITAQKEAQVQIEEEQQKFEAMVSNVPGAIYRAVDDSEWPIIYLSDEIQKITGYPASDFMESKIVSFSTIMHPDDVEPMGKIITEQFAKGKSFQIDYRVIAKNGEIKWVRSQGQSVKTDNGKAFIDGVLIDITKAKEAEAKIELLTELVYGSLKSASVGAWWVDFTEEDTFHALKNTTEMIGIDFKTEDSDACVISEWGNVLQETASLSDEYKKAIDNTFENFTGAISGKYESYHAVYPIAYSNGEVKWIEARADVPKRDKDGNALLMTGTLIDITDIKKAQVKIEQQQQQFESMVSNTPGVIYRINESDRSIVFMSEQISQLTGYPVSYFDSEDKYYNLINPDDLEKIVSIAKQEKHAGDHAAVEYRITHKDGSIKWVRNQRNVIENENGELLNDGTIFDITDVIEAQEKIEESRLFLNTLLDSQEQIIITTDGVTIVTANEAFLNFYSVDSIEKFIEEYDANCICDTFNTEAHDGYLQKSMGDEKWIDYIIARSASNIIHKAMITRDGIDYIFSVTAAILPGDEGLKSAVFTDITAMELAKQEIEAIHKHTRESIEYASLIQGALVPEQDNFKNYFSDFFTIWQPKDIVGGDIYLFEELRDRDECLLMVIDCTGHGVPGAFVTMLVKALERQVVAKIENDRNIDVSPAWILSYFNRKMKTLLHQDNADSISNAGFDGGIIYYNKKEKTIKFAGAETALMYMDESNELQTIKGSRHSIGYKKSDASFEFKEHTINVKEGMKFYCTTDGYVDQNGGEKGFPLGKKKFQNIIKEYHDEKMVDQQEVFLNELAAYQGDEETNDDVTFVGFRV